MTCEAGNKERERDEYQHELDALRTELQSNVERFEMELQEAWTELVELRALRANEREKVLQIDRQRRIIAGELARFDGSSSMLN
jgi:hypothetical protein